MNIHKGTFILVSGAFLKCFSIYSQKKQFYYKRVGFEGVSITRTCVAVHVLLFEVSI